MGGPPGNPPEPADPWLTIVEIGLQERAFNTLQATYRTLGSTWLLATFGGVGFMWSLKADPTLPVPIDVVILFIGIAGAVGITLVWLLDLIVYHQLLEVVFWTGLAVELEHPDIPPMRLQMFATEAVSPKVEKFYLAMLTAPLLIATVAGTAAAPLAAVGSEPIALALGLFASALWVTLVARQTERTRSRLERHFWPVRRVAKVRLREWQDQWESRAADARSEGMASNSES